MEQKIFYPWSVQTAEEWIKENQSSIEVVGTTSRPYVPKGENEIPGELIIVYYKETKCLRAKS